MCEGSKEGELPLASDAQPPEPFCSQAICWLSRSLGAKSAVSPPCQGPSKTLLHFYLMPATTTKLCPRYQPFPKVLLFSPAFHGGKSQTIYGFSLPRRGSEKVSLAMASTPVAYFYNCPPFPLQWRKEIGENLFCVSAKSFRG